MSDTIIKVENVGKKYVISHQIGNVRQRTLRDSIVDGAKTFANKLGVFQKNNDPSHEEFWALNDVSFEIKKGDRVGVIGRNGAGKSTLLKILSRITEPTQGRITINGRVASLLEVGTGFHAELTGRENIYLNGAILGMSKVEIRRKFDEIVAFSEVEKFLDTPVKRYSSGMYVRLAFAVAAHLEPEILIVDEVLAVGDMDFQRKCMAKMESVSEGGRTVLFVSHNMAAIKSLCSRAIFLQKGRCLADGKSDEIISKYVMGDGLNEYSLLSRNDRSGSQSVIASNIAFYSDYDESIGQILCGDSVILKVQYKNNKNLTLNNIHLGIGFYDIYGRAMTFLQTQPLGISLTAFEGIGEFRCRIPKFRLTPGLYWLNYEIRQNNELCDALEQAIRFEVIEGDFFGTGKLTYSEIGGFLTEHEWII